MPNINTEFASALVEVQKNLEGAKKSSRNPGFNSKYANLQACWDACSEALSSAGIAVLQWPTESPDGYVRLRTELVHGKTGEVLSDVYLVPLKDPKNPQALGSAITYARRYALCSILGICPEDDDGNAATATPAKRANSAPKAPAAEVAKPAFDEAGIKSEFDAAKPEDRRAIYARVKQSSLQEPTKTELLTYMLNKGKETTVKDTNNG